MPDGRYPWMQSHAQNPTVLLLDDRLRVFYTCRPKPDAAGKYMAVTSFFDVDRSDPNKLLYVHDETVLPLGERGTFDQFGIMPGAIVRVGREVWLYYVGWMRCEGVPYLHSIGLAISIDDGRTFRRVGPGPVIDRTCNEPFLQNSPTVLVIDGHFHMWYSSGTRWLEQQGRMESIYVLMHATSLDGLRWDRDGERCIPAVVPEECQTNPTVLAEDGGFNMWFCYRHGLDFRNSERGYRIGYARSPDLALWQRDDARGTLEPSTSGWDSGMVCYPCVVSVDGRTYMFYSGNSFGQGGIGLAVLVS